MARESGEAAESAPGPGAAAIGAGSAVFLSATLLHPGHDPGDLAASLPEYAASDAWLAVHLAQLCGLVVVVAGLWILAGSLGADRPSTALTARAGLVAAVAAVVLYAVNQAVDGVGIKFVADNYVASTPAERADALLLAEAVRHVEIGTSSLTGLAFGISLVFFGVALSRSPRFSPWLGRVGVAGGVGLMVAATLTASRGFDVTVSPPVQLLGAVVGGWLVWLTAALWRLRRGVPARPGAGS